MLSFGQVTMSVEELTKRADEVFLLDEGELFEVDGWHVERARW